MSSKIGFVGLGIMGKPMSKNLLKAGHKLVVYDVVPQPLEELAAAGAAKGSSGWSYAWIPVVGPIIGGMLGAGLFALIGF